MYDWSWRGDNDFLAATPCSCLASTILVLLHSKYEFLLRANFLKITPPFMNAMGDDGFLGGILYFWETKILQIIVFRSAITSYSSIFFLFFLR